MKFNIKAISVFVSFGLTPFAFAQTFNFAVDSFSNPTTFDFGGTPGTFRFYQTTSNFAGQTPTHIILESLSAPDASHPQLAVSGYVAVNSGTGETGETGVVVMNLPAEALPSVDTAASPIIGIIPRSGPWTQFTPESPATALAAAAGNSGYTANTLNLSATNSSGTWTGQVPYSVTDTDTLSLETFSLTNGASTISFAATSLLRDGLEFYGVIQSTSGTIDLDNFYHGIRLTNLPNLDGDDLPDISDPEIDAGSVWYAPFTTVANKTESDWFGGFWFASDPSYLYHEEHGWFYLIVESGSQPEILLFDWEFGGWILTNSTLYSRGLIYSFADSSWLYYYRDGGLLTQSGLRWFYHYNEDRFFNRPASTF